MTRRDGTNEQQPGLGDDFLDEYEAALERIESEPTSFSRLETIRTPHEIRRCVMKRFPYVLVFQVIEGEAVVLAVMHARRRPNYWINRAE